jgi:FtsP/CotA-like multicopper oxidase with cupredoxin domain
MRPAFRFLLILFAALLPAVTAAAQCPQRPKVGTIVENPFDLVSTNGVLKAEFTLRHSVDDGGYTHYCYNYKTDQGDVEAPTLRLNPGDRLLLHVTDRIKDDGDDMGAMDSMSGPPSTTCGDTGTMTISSTNVHFHGLNVPPKCHQDDVLNTLIQPGTPGFDFNMQIPANEPPGLYWYHPHIHGFTEFQVNGGAAGALIVEGMEKLRPEVAGLAERVFIVRQQYLVPWIPGPYQLTLNYQTAIFPNLPSPLVKMKPHEKQFWRVANATLQDFMPLQVLANGQALKLQLIALDGYPLAKPRYEDTILLPPAGRAEFIVEAPDQGIPTTLLTNEYSTGITGNLDLRQILAKIEVSKNEEDAAEPSQPVSLPPQVSPNSIKFAGLDAQKPIKSRKLFFSEKFGGTGGPIEFYITLDGHKPRIFESTEKPIITTHVGAVEDWIIENRALETHAFHIHQIHFSVLEVDGRPVKNHDLRDTIEVPFWEGQGHPYHSVKVRMDFRDPAIAGTFVFHCHILLHEDLGMMHKILVKK